MSGGASNRAPRALATRMLPLLTAAVAVLAVAGAQPGFAGQKAAAAGHNRAADRRSSVSAPFSRSGKIDDQVIVIMKSQPRPVRPGTSASAMRAAVIARSQSGAGRLGHGCANSYLFSAIDARIDRTGSVAARHRGPSDARLGDPVR